ncbi:hypothetical protein BKA66DRAFT_460968 [Pyrenochaeta sp. MPI-SDFR-AT-0127]|nr:hypothetical protein BKA66DRAFT_460968 [Pyrenochaeta sp. MPI-SDFR-AT-0127]
MSSYGHVTMQPPTHGYLTVQQHDKFETAYHPVVIETGNLDYSDRKAKRKYYKPMELRTPFLIIFCVFTMIIFTLLQLAAAAFMGAPGLHSLASRSVDSTSDCPVGATCAPAAGSWSNTYASPTPSGPTAPGPESYTSTAGWTPARYFVGAYLPTMVAIIFSIWWKCIFARLKEMEPFYQFSKPGGASAKDSLLLSYPGAALPSVLWSSLSSGHWLSFLGAINSVLVTICTLFASETLFIASHGDGCRVVIDPTSDTNDECTLYLSMRPPLAWALGVVLFSITVLTATAIVQLHRRVSGIFAEATSFAGIASLCSQRLAQESAQSLQDHSRRYTLVPSDSHGTNTIELTTSPYQSPEFQQIQTSTYKKTKYERVPMHPASLVAFCLFLVAVIFMVLYYRFISKPGTGNLLEDFMNSQSFGVRLFMSAIGLSIKFYWGWIEQYIRSVGPYTALASLHGASADQSVLVRSPSHPVAALLYSDTWRHLLLSFVTMMAILSEVLVITLNAIPFTTATAYLAFKLSVYISVGILAVMIITVPAVLFWKLKRNRSEIPDVPECIADAFALLSNASGWNALGMLDEKTRNEAIRNWQVRFALRRARGSEFSNSGWCIVALRPGETAA